jgi:hypothetical protein
MDIRPERPPLAMPTIWGWIAAAALLLALAAAYLAWRRYRRSAKRLPPPVVIPPYRRALDRLRAALDRIHDPERFCVLVSDAVRWYLEERFQWRAPERTTEEFLAELRAGDRLSSLQQELMSDFLTRCDLVKFARHEPAEPELRQLHESAVRLVEETEPLLQAMSAPGSSGARPPRPALTH